MYTDYLSVKDYRNRPGRYDGSNRSSNDIVHVNTINPSMNERFMDISNQHRVIKQTYMANRKNGSNFTIGFFEKTVPILMKKYSDEHNLDDYEDLTSSNWYESLMFINNIFVEDNKAVMPSDTNVYREKYVTGHVNEYENRLLAKRPTDLTADDIKSLNVWQKQEVLVWNKKYRNNNRIYVKNTSVCHRPYDRDNDGLRHDRWEESSLEVPIRGYNMASIYESCGKYRDRDKLTAI